MKKMETRTKFDRLGLVLFSCCVVVAASLLLLRLLWEETNGDKKASSPHSLCNVRIPRRGPKKGGFGAKIGERERGIKEE